MSKMNTITKEIIKEESEKLDVCPFCECKTEFITNKSKQIILQHRPEIGVLCPARCEIYCESFEFGFSLWNKKNIRLDGTENITTFGGEAYLDNYEFAEYGINFDKISIDRITPIQMVKLACTIVDHLLLCRHKLKIINTNEQDQTERLIEEK